MVGPGWYLLLMYSRYILCRKDQQESEVYNGRPGLKVSDNRFEPPPAPPVSH